MWYNRIMKKFLLLFPPFWIINSPHIALPILASHLESAKYNVTVRDLNIEFINEVCTENFIKKIIPKMRNELTELEEEKKSFYNKDNLYKNKILTERYNELKNFFDKNYIQYENIHLIINNCVKIIKTSKQNLLENKEELVTIYNALNLVKLYYSSCSEQLPYNMLSFNDVTNFIKDEKHNLFLNFYKDKIKELSKNYDCIGISIGTEYQLNAGLTLAYLLKTQLNSHIFLGGNHISRIATILKNYPQFFDIYADEILYESSENSIIKYAQYINNEIDIQKVPNIIYKKIDNVIVNTKESGFIKHKIKSPNFSDYDISKYITNTPTLPLQIQTGCYWRKCSFCDFSHGSTYKVKKISDVIEELKQNKIKYNVSNYFIVDEAIPPNLLEKLSDEILKNNLSVKFSIYARFEKSFNKRILEKAYKAGFKNINWGLESANKRILKLMNKGIDIKTVHRILKLSSKVGIKNGVSILFKFPTETFNEALDTITFLKNNKKYINGIAVSEFGLGRYSNVAHNPNKYKVELCKKQMDFSHALGFKTKTLNEEEKQMIFDKINEIKKELKY